MQWYSIHEALGSIPSAYTCLYTLYANMHIHTYIHVYKHLKYNPVNMTSETAKEKKTVEKLGGKQWFGKENETKEEKKRLIS